MQGEVLVGPERRRRWSAEEKSRIIAESLRPGAQVTDIARRHGVSRGLLYTWRREVGRRETGWLPSAPAKPAGPDFVPVLLSAPEHPHSAIATAETTGLDRGSQRAPKRFAPSGGEIEVVLPGGARLTLHGRVDATTLRAVLAALRV
jgi:transposase